MRFARIEAIAPGTRLGKTLYREDGRILLQRGTELTEEYLGLLQKQGFMALYLLDPHSDDVEIREPLTERTRQEALSAVREVFRRSREPQEGLDQEWVSRRILYNSATSILADLTEHKDLNLQIAEMRSTNAYGFQHAVNVTVLGLALAIRIGYGYDKLSDLAMGLLIHDIGKNALDPLVAQLHEGHEPVLEPQYRQHPRLGFDLLQQMGRALSAPAKIVALQHHERWDGSGFPMGLAGKAIHEFAQIAAIANTYDNLTHEIGPYGPAPAHMAMEYLMAAGGSHFSHALVSEFLKLLVPFPIDSAVRLSTREEGLIVAIDKGLPMRPTVRVTIDPDGIMRRDPYELDLRRHPDITILRTL